MAVPGARSLQHDGRGRYRRRKVHTPTGWREDIRSPEIVLFYRDNDKAQAREYQGVGDVDAPPDVVFAVVTDVEAHPKFMPYTKESKIVEHINANEVIAYQVIAAPLVSERDYFLHIKLIPGASPATVWRSEWNAVPDYKPEAKGLVRMRIAEGYWLFEPLDGGKRTRVTYTSLTNIGGSIPGWIVNMSNKGIIPKIFESVRKRVAERLARK